MNSPVNQFEHFPETLPNEQGYISGGAQRTERSADVAFTPITPDIAPSMAPIEPEQSTPEKLGGHARVWAAHSLMMHLRANHPAFPTIEPNQTDVVPRGAYGDRIDPYHWN